MQITNAVAVSTLLVAGCLDVTSEPEDTSETSQELTSLGIWSWGQLDGHLDLGPASTQTCFLRGIHGSLAGVRNGTESWEAGAVVSIQNGRWDLYTFHGGGPGVSGQVTCIPNTANRTFLTTHFGTATIAATANRQCFLTSVRSYGNSWVLPLHDGSLPRATLTIENGSWVFRQNTRDDANPDGVVYGGHEEAVCVDVPITGLYGWSYHAGATKLVETIVPAPDAGWGCGLVGLHGTFTDTWDKPGVEAAPIANNTWTLTVAPNKQGDVRCIY